MVIRCIWIISIMPESVGKVLYNKKFPTVEKRAKLLLKDNYFAVPNAEELSKSLMLAFGISSDSKHFIEWRDKTSSRLRIPAVSVQIGDQEISPLITVEQSFCLICCLPLVEDSKKTDFLSSPSISIGFSVLIGILQFLGTQTVLKSELASRFIELDNYLALSLPFGTPYDTDPMNIMAFYNSSSTSSQKRPAIAKQTSNKGKLNISFVISEYVRSANCGQPDFVPVTDLYGSVIAKVENEVCINDISLILDNVNADEQLKLNSLIIHPFVQPLTSSSIAGVPKKLLFKPLPHSFTLCFYTASCTEPPITGTFKLKGHMSVELSIALKLSEKMKNSFQFCDVFVPFFHQGPISTYEFKCSQGTLGLSEDKHALKWNIGQKFLSKSRDVFMTAKVELKTSPLPNHNDPFCVGKNSYIQISFKEADYTLSGCNIDPKTVNVSPSLKAKIITERTLSSTEFRIWNTFGDVPFPIVPHEKWPKP